MTQTSELIDIQAMKKDLGNFLQKEAKVHLDDSIKILNKWIQENLETARQILNDMILDGKIVINQTFEQCIAKVSSCSKQELTKEQIETILRRKSCKNDEGWVVEERKIRFEKAKKDLPEFCTTSAIENMGISSHHIIQVEAGKNNLTILQQYSKGSTGAKFNLYKKEDVLNWIKKRWNINDDNKS